MSDEAQGLNNKILFAEVPHADKLELVGPHAVNMALQREGPLWRASKLKSNLVIRCCFGAPDLLENSS